ncbi:hypothetical protein FKP32DRAFT_1554586, partial [Trametes sanguinea]
LLRVARTYNVCMFTRSPDESLKEALPAWAHFALKSRTHRPNAPAAKCLRHNHHAATVGDFLRVAGRIGARAGPDRHVNSAACRCTACEHDRLVLGCTAPHRCATFAQCTLDRLAPKWAPNVTDKTDGLSLTGNRKRHNVAARAEGGDVLFDPSAAEKAPIASVFRAFVPRDLGDVYTRRAALPYAVPGEEKTVYVHGSIR